jgi:hypothetical protein
MEEFEKIYSLGILLNESFFSVPGKQNITGRGKDYG